MGIRHRCVKLKERSVKRSDALDHIVRDGVKSVALRDVRTSSTAYIRSQWHRSSYVVWRAYAVDDVGTSYVQQC